MLLNLISYITLNIQEVNTISNIDTALGIVDKFQATTPQEGVAWILDRDQTLNRLRAILRQPELIHQRALNACGPAIFFRTWFSRDPVAAANFSCTLLRDGSARIGPLTVNAGWKLLGQNYSKLRSHTDGLQPDSTPETADWMLISALRQSENLWWDYAGELNTATDKAAGITLPGTLAGWLSATNVYSSVKDDTSLVLPSDRGGLLSLQTPPHVDVLLLVDSSVTSLYLIPIVDVPDRGWIPIPNHYIAMLSPITLYPADSRWLHIDIWTWGTNRSGWQGSEKLLNNYFGAIVATV